MSSVCKVRREIVTNGFDEYLALVGGDPDGSTTSMGLRVPTLATPAGVAGLSDRYLFLLASFSLGEGECARIIGYRQFVSLGYAQSFGNPDGGTNGFRVVEQEVFSPNFRFPDGNVSWHLRTMGPPNAQQIPQQGSASMRSKGPDASCDSFVYQWADTPALLFGTGQSVPPGRIYPNLSSYTPPNGGKPWGTGIATGLGTFYDLRTQWRTHGAWTSLDIPVQGPDTIGFFASVRQTNPSTRPPLTLLSIKAPNGLSAEEQFLLNFPNAIYWRVGGALIVESA